MINIRRWGCYLKDIDHIEWIPPKGKYGETVSAAAKRVKWNDRSPDCICNAELFNMKNYNPASGCSDHITQTFGFSFVDGIKPVLSYANNVKSKDWIAGYPMLVRDGENIVDRVPAGLGGKTARTALAFNGSVFSVIYTTAADRCTLKEFADAIVNAGYTMAINLDGGGSTACISPFVAYDQCRNVRGKIAIWSKNGTGNRLCRK